MLPAEISEAELAALDVALRALGDQQRQAGPAQSAVRGPDGADVSDALSQDGLEQVLRSGLIAYERLPMLEIVFDRLVRITSTSMRNFTSDNVEISFAGLQSLRFGDYIDTVEEPALIVVFRAEQWDNFGLIVVDAHLANVVVDVLLGGRPSLLGIPNTRRGFTAIERALIERLVHVVLDDLAEAFAPLGNVEFHFDRLEVNPRFAAISSASNAAMLARLDLRIDGRGGELRVLLPYATLEPVRELLLQQFMGEKLGRDTIWETHLAAELRRTKVVLDVVLDQQTLDFGTIVNLSVGDRLPLSVGPNAPVLLYCAGTPVLEGHAGRANGQLVVQIERVLKPDVEQRT
jgi:flagellar motor switch protein FliM